VAPLLEAKGVSVYFGGVAALADLSMTIEKGEILGVIGPNGSGKTTFINVLTKMYVADEGSIDFKGERIDHLAPHQITDKGIARTFQNLRIFKNLSVLDNVIIGAHRHIQTNFFSLFLRPGHHLSEERKARRQAMELLELVGLARKVNELAKNLPYGEQRRLELARALATEPDLLLLDEPTAGMNPNESLAMIDLLRAVNQRATLLIIEHNMKMIMNLAQRLVVLNAGQIIFEGTPTQVQQNERVQEIYLGKEET